MSDHLNKYSGNISSDHDLLVVVYEQLKQVRVDIASLKNGTESRIDDHEARLKIVETNTTKMLAYGTAIIFIVGMAQFFIQKFL